MSPSRRPSNGVRNGSRFLTQRSTKSVCARCIGTQRFFKDFRWGAGGACGHGVRVAKPRTAPRRGGAMGTSRPTATGHGRCARPRGAGEGWCVMAADMTGCNGGRYDNGARVVRAATVHERCARQRCTRGAHGHGARAVCAATVHGQCARQRGARGAWFLRAHFENHKEQRGRAFVFRSLHRNGLCVPLCSFSRGAGPHHGALRRDGEPPHPLAKKRLRRTFQLTESVSYANMNATRDESLFRPCGKFPFDKSSILRFSIL